MKPRLASRSRRRPLRVSSGWIRRMSSSEPAKAACTASSQMRAAANRPSDVRGASTGANLGDDGRPGDHNPAVPGQQQQRDRDGREAVEEAEVPSDEVSEGDDGEGPDGDLRGGTPPTTLVRRQEKGEHREQQDGIEGV